MAQSINEPSGQVRQGYTPTSINEPSSLPPVLTKTTPASGPANATPGATFILNVSTMAGKSGDVVVFDGADMATDFINAAVLRSVMTPCSPTARAVNVMVKRGSILSNTMQFRFV